MLVLELREEARDAIRGDGKGDASCYLERVDADDLTILGKESKVWCYLVGCQAELAVSAPLRCPKQPQLACKDGSLGHISVSDPYPVYHQILGNLSILPVEGLPQKLLGCSCLPTSSPSALGGSVHCTQDTFSPHQRPGPLLSLSYESRDH